LPALLSAITAGLGATLAVFRVMLAAFGCAGITHRRTKHAHLVDELRSPAHERCGLPANGGTIAVETDAIDHALEIILVETGVGTMVTFQGATHTNFNTRLILPVGHEDTLLR